MKKIGKILSYGLINIIIVNSAEAKTALEVAREHPVGAWIMEHTKQLQGKDYGTYDPSTSVTDQSFASQTAVGTYYADAADLPQSALISIILGKSRDDVMEILNAMGLSTKIGLLSSTTTFDKNKAYVTVEVKEKGTSFYVDSLKEVFYITAKGEKRVFKPDNTFSIPTNVYQEAGYPVSTGTNANTTNTALNSPAFLETLFQAAKEQGPINEEVNLFTNRGLMLLNPGAKSFAQMSLSLKAPKDAVAETVPSWPVMLLNDLSKATTFSKADQFFMASGEGKPSAKKQQLNYNLLHKRGDVFTPLINTSSVSSAQNTWMNLGELVLKGTVSELATPPTRATHEFSTSFGGTSKENPIFEVGSKRYCVLGNDLVYTDKLSNQITASGIPAVYQSDGLLAKATMGMHLLDGGTSIDLIADGAYNRSDASLFTTGDLYTSTGQNGYMQLDINGEGALPIEILMAIIEGRPQKEIDGLFFEWLHGCGYKRVLVDQAIAGLGTTDQFYNPIKQETNSGMTPIKWNNQAEPRLYADLNDFVFKLADNSTYKLQEGDVVNVDSNTITTKNGTKKTCATIGNTDETYHYEYETKLWDYVAHKRGTTDPLKENFKDVYSKMLGSDTTHKFRLKIVNGRFALSVVINPGSGETETTLTAENVFLIKRGQESATNEQIINENIHPTDRANYGQSGFLVAVGNQYERYFATKGMGAKADNAAGETRPNLWVDYMARVQKASGTVPSLKELGEYVYIDVVQANNDTKHLKSITDATDLKNTNWKVVLQYTTQPNTDPERYCGKVRPGCPGVYKKNGELYVMLGDIDLKLTPTSTAAGTIYSATIGDATHPIEWGVASANSVNKITSTYKGDIFANWLQDYIEFSNYKDGATETSIIA